MSEEIQPVDKVTRVEPRRLMKLALVHDWLNSLGGAERVLIELHNIFPDAPIYTLFYDKKFKVEYLPNAEIRPSFLQKLPFINRHYKYAALLMPSAIESFDLSEFDLVISSSVFFSKGLVLRPKTKHICYCYSPTRQLWDLHVAKSLTTNDQSFSPSTLSFKLAQHLLRLWDRQAADRVDEFIAISEHVRERIKKYYRKDAKVIYPPLTLETSNKKQDTKSKKDTWSLGNLSHGRYYLIVSRLYPHKNIDITIDAFNKLNLPLVVVGTGPEFKSLKSQVSNLKSIRFVGLVPDEELPEYYANCKAFIMPQEEDFGLTPIEAMSFGKPVLALRKGGAMEIMQEGITGEFFNDPIPEAVADGIRRLNENYHNYRPDIIESRAKEFSKERFKKEILQLTHTHTTV